MSKHPEAVGQPYLLFIPVEQDLSNLASGIKLGLETIPEYVVHSNHWLTRPAGICLVSDLRSNTCVIVDTVHPNWEVTKQYQNPLPDNQRPRLSAVILTIDQPIEPSEINQKFKVLASAVRRGKTADDENPGAFIVLEVIENKPQFVEIQRRTRLLSAAGFADAKFSSLKSKSNLLAPGQKLLVWDARLKKIPHNPEMDKQKTVFNGIIGDIGRRYELLGFKIFNRSELEQKFLNAEGNFWAKSEHLRQGYGVTLTCDTGCKWDLEKGNGYLCSRHRNENAPPPFSDASPHEHKNPKEYKPFLDEFNAQPGSPSQMVGINCPQRDCGGLPLIAVVRIIRESRKGYIVSMDIDCPEDGWLVRDVLLADGLDRSHLKSIRVISREYK